MTPTAFIKWMTRHKFTNKAAANTLGISVSAIVDLRQGVTRSTGASRLLDRRTELACMAVDAGLHTESKLTHIGFMGFNGTERPIYVMLTSAEAVARSEDTQTKAIQDVKVATEFLKGRPE